MAVILSGMVVGGVQSALNLFWPDHPFAPYMSELDIWVQGVIMVAAGYLTKEKIDEDLDKASGVEEPTPSDDGQLVLPLVQSYQKEGGPSGDGEQTSKGQGATS